MPDPLRQTAQTRLSALRTELANGRDALTQLEHRRAQIADTLLRIEGAVQVLEEVLATPEPALPSADVQAPEEPLCPNPCAAEHTTLP
jgi:ABC-type transporter Mla subunit MlaD